LLFVSVEGRHRRQTLLMADRSWNDRQDDVMPGWLNGEMKDVFAGASILLVEDDPDIRELVSTLLSMAGYEPTTCSSAEAALEQLREQPFDLVLTDYALPHRTGGWLLEQAREEGLLDATAALVVTAHPNPAGVDGYEIIAKPFDLDHLVTRITHRLSGVGPSRMVSRSMIPSNRPGDDSGGGDCPDPVELVLYVSASSPKSAAAITNIRSVLSRFSSERVRLTIHDLSQDPNAGAQDSVAFTPTLVKRSPGPRTFILGHIANPDILVEILQSCGEELA
jgi:DNA-binding response OmpR family regulator